MSVKITGLNLLNSNVYDRILITEKQSDYRVYIQKHKNPNAEAIPKFKGIPTEYRFSDELKDKTDEEKLISITRKFLEYANISKISKDYLAYNKIYDVASGTREFRMQIFNPNLKVIAYMVMQKYLNDRLKFIYENKNINAMTISLEAQSSYTKSPYHISLELLRGNDGKPVDFEKEFLNDLIYTKLNEIGDYATLGPRRYLSSIFMHKETLAQHILTCGDLRIILGNDRYLLKEVEKIVDNYNTELHRNKVMQMNMQMKMEGF